MYLLFYIMICNALSKNLVRDVSQRTCQSPRNGREPASSASEPKAYMSVKTVSWAKETKSYGAIKRREQVKIVVDTPPDTFIRT